MRIEPLQGKALAAIRMPPAHVTAYEGSVRSAKTFTSLLDWLKFIRTAPPGNLLMTGRTERTIINNLLLPLQEMLGVERIKINRGNGSATILARAVLITGANNEAARTKIQGLTLVGSYVDEASTLPESYFNMLYSRHSLEGSRLWLTSNPEGPAHWLKTRWLDRAQLWIDRHGIEHVRAPGGYEDGDPGQPIDLNRVTFALEDNPNLPESYVRRIKASYTGLWYRRYVLGEWCVAEGAIYEDWDPERHVVPADNLPPIARIIAVGMDHGTTNPTRGILLGISSEPQPRLVALDEWAPKSASNVEYSAGFKTWLSGQPKPWRNPPWLYVDSAAADFKLQLFNDGWNNVAGATSKVTTGIGLVSSLLAAGLLVVSSSCVELIKEFPSYTWDPKATERGEDAPNKAAGHDHSLDALRYAISPTRALWMDDIKMKLDLPLLSGD